MNTTKNVTLGTNARPCEITNAFIAIIISICIGFLDLLLQKFGLLKQMAEWGSLGEFVIGVIITLVLIFFISKRHNWARITFCTITIITIPLVLPLLSQELKVNIIGAFSTTIQLILQILAVYFLLTKNSKQWFKK